MNDNIDTDDEFGGYKIPPELVGQFKEFMKMLSNEIFILRVIEIDRKTFEIVAERIEYWDGKSTNKEPIKSEVIWRRK